MEIQTQYFFSLLVDIALKQYGWWEFCGLLPQNDYKPYIKEVHIGSVVSKILRYRLTNRQTYQQTKQTYRLTDRHTDQQTDRQTDQPTNRQTDIQTNRETNKQTDKHPVTL